jgi:gamma-glutamyl hydrolase
MTRSSLLFLLAIYHLLLHTCSASRPLDEKGTGIEGNDTFPAPWQRPYANTKPLIGILAQACHYCPGRSYVAAGFVKWVEAAGGRAVPIRKARAPTLRRMHLLCASLVWLLLLFQTFLTPAPPLLQVL